LQEKYKKFLKSKKKNTLFKKFCDKLLSYKTEKVLLNGILLAREYRKQKRR